MRVPARLGAAVAATAGWLGGAMIALAATPSPSLAPGGDPRSSGQGPGLVGNPALALLVVAAIGVGAVVVTLVYLRLTARRS